MGIIKPKPIVRLSRKMVLGRFKNIPKSVSSSISPPKLAESESIDERSVELLKKFIRTYL